MDPVASGGHSQPLQLRPQDIRLGRSDRGPLQLLLLHRVPEVLRADYQLTPKVKTDCKEKICGLNRVLLLLLYLAPYSLT
jgi:hypothetical protein